MPRPATYLDECVGQYLAHFLRQRGFSVTPPQEAGLLGASDGAQLAFAAQRQFAGMTFNNGLSGASGFSMPIIPRKTCGGRLAIQSNRFSHATGIGACYPCAG